MRRREFISLLGGAAAWPQAARAQREQKRRVAVLMGGLLSGDANGQAEAGALEDALQERGWRQGGNIELTYRWPGAELDSVRAAASEIAASRPDLVVSRSTPATSALMSAGLPTVFVLVADPIRSGFVQNLAHPGRQRYRVHEFRSFGRRQMARASQRGRAERHACYAVVQSADRALCRKLSARGASRRRNLLAPP